MKQRLFTETVRWRGVRVKVRFYFTPGSSATREEPATEPEIDTQSAWIVDDDDQHIGYVQAGLRREFDKYAHEHLVTSVLERLKG